MAAPAEVRCPGTMHARLVNGELEVKCGRRKCGARPGVVVLHRFSLSSGELRSTHTYKDPGGSR